MMGFALVARRKSPRSRLNSAYAPAPSKAVRGPLGVNRVEQQCLRCPVWPQLLSRCCGATIGQKVPIPAGGRCSKLPRYSITSSASASNLSPDFEAERLGGLQVDQHLVLG